MKVSTELAMRSVSEQRFLIILVLSRPCPASHQRAPCLALAETVDCGVHLCHGKYLFHSRHAHGDRAAWPSRVGGTTATSSYATHVRARSGHHQSATGKSRARLAFDQSEKESRNAEDEGSRIRVPRKEASRCDRRVEETPGTRQQRRVPASAAAGLPGLRR